MPERSKRTKENKGEKKEDMSTDEDDLAPVFYDATGFHSGTVNEETGLLRSEIETDEKKHRGWMFFIICLLQMLANFDSGVLPATLSHVQTSFTPPISDADAGVMGSLLYIGLMFSCPVSGYLLTVYRNQRIIICGAILMNALAVLAMALAPSAWYLYVSRFFIGFLQAPIFIYAPVWVDEFAPPESMTLWVSLLQANVALGIMLGYLSGSIAVTNFGPNAWRFAVMMQFFLLCPLVLIFLCVPGRHVNVISAHKKYLKERMREQQAKAHKKYLKERIREQQAKAHITENGRDIVTVGKLAADLNNAASEDDGEDVATRSRSGSYNSFDLDNEEPPPHTAREALSELLHCPVYLWLTFALAGLYWVVTGIQFWITKYMIQVLDTDEQQAAYGFAFTSLTGPTAGVFFGGYVIDKLGGYKDESGEATVTTLRVCCLFSVGATVFAIPSALTMNFWVLMCSVWVVLFFGGALLPAVTGVCVSSVPPDIRSFSSSVSMFIYNLLGYAAAPLAVGLISSSIGGKDGLRFGFQINQVFAGVAVIMVLGAYFAAKGELIKHKQMLDDEEFDDEIGKAVQDRIAEYGKLEDGEKSASALFLGPRSKSNGTHSSANSPLRTSNSRSQAPSDFVITMGGISNAVSNGHCIVSTAHNGRLESVVSARGKSLGFENNRDDEDMIRAPLLHYFP